MVTRAHPQTQTAAVTSEDCIFKYKAEIARTARPQKNVKRVLCPYCTDHPCGFRSDNEKQRHIDRQHRIRRKVWICTEKESGGSFLAGCKACRKRKTYGANYNAGAHLRRVHFNPKGRHPCKDGERRGGTGGGTQPPMDELLQWMYQAEEVEGRVVSISAIVDSAPIPTHLPAMIQDNLKFSELPNENARPSTIVERMQTTYPEIDFKPNINFHDMAHALCASIPTPPNNNRAEGQGWPVTTSPTYSCEWNTASVCSQAATYGNLWVLSQGKAPKLETGGTELDAYCQTPQIENVVGDAAFPNSVCSKFVNSGQFFWSFAGGQSLNDVGIPTWWREWQWPVAGAGQPFNASQGYWANNIPYSYLTT